MAVITITTNGTGLAQPQPDKGGRGWWWLWIRHWVWCWIRCVVWGWFWGEAQERIIDVAWEVAGEQEVLLGEYPAATAGSLDDLTADDFPIIPLLVGG